MVVVLLIKVCYSGSGRGLAVVVIVAAFGVGVRCSAGGMVVAEALVISNSFFVVICQIPVPTTI